MIGVVDAIAFFHGLADTLIAICVKHPNDICSLHVLQVDCVERTVCKSETGSPKCLEVEKCDAPCNGFQLVAATSGFGLQQSRTGLRFKACNADATCLTAVDGCVATGPNDMCVTVIENCIASDTQKCYARKPCSN